MDSSDRLPDFAASRSGTPRLFLCLANKHNTFQAFKSRQILFGDLVFPLTFLKQHDGNLVLLDITFNRCNELLADGSDQRRRRDRLLAVRSTKFDDSVDIL